MKRYIISAYKNLHRGSVQNAIVSYRLTFDTHRQRNRPHVLVPMSYKVLI